MDWHDVIYLTNGSERQKNAYQAITTLGVFEILKEYTPILVGTIPLNVDVKNSDLDVICEVHDHSTFLSLLRKSFGHHSGFRQSHYCLKGIETTVTNFFFEQFEFEIFGQPIPTKHQNAYRHMVIEERLLRIGGEGSYKAIRELKTNGYKTEPAFVTYFQIKCDDPYAKLLELECWTDEDLRNLLMK